MFSEGFPMRQALTVLAFLLLATPQSALAQPPQVRLWTLDCGAFLATHESDECYLIQHGDRYMLWDLGLGEELAARPAQMVRKYQVALVVSLRQQLAMLSLTPEKIDYVAVSHSHFDHVGQLPAFPHATLLIGKGDWDALPTGRPEIAERFKPWSEGGAPKILVEGDKDVFGDGTVVMFATPGHTPGHHSLLVTLKNAGPVMLSGDLYDTQQQYHDATVLPGNADPAATRASIKRFNEMAASLHAMVVITHDPADMSKMPLFPQPLD
jgi:N-acyl homoserine lactone hydrolase